MSTKRPKPRKAAARKAKTPGEMPSREDILAFVAENPGKAGKREVARHFGIVGAARIQLKRMLRDLADEGVVETRQKRLIRPGDLPPVLVVHLNARDADGELLGEPVNWDEEAGAPPKLLVLTGRTTAKTSQPGLGDRALVRLTEADPGAESTHAARVIKVLEKQQGAILGILRRRPGRHPPYLEPIDRKQRELDIDPSDLKDAEEGDLVSVQVTRTGRYGAPRAKIVRRFGAMHSEMAVSEIALHSHGIPHVFPAAVELEAERAEPIGLGQREDWRKLPLITIDPPDAKDHDDAVFAEPDQDPANQGGHVVYVAIADVAHYVRPGSALDREAHLRGNSVYFPDRVIPMLPERISNELCSLKEAVDRPALAVRMVFDRAGQKRAHSFHRILMRSAAKLSYQQAQKAIDGVCDDKTGTLLDGILKPLWVAYACLTIGRDAREPLDLDLPERKIRLKPDGTVDHVYIPERLDAHRLIEEFMIQANVAAAETLEKKNTPLLYRIHDASSPEKLESLKEFLSTLGLKLPSSGGLRPAVFNAILARVKDTPQAQLVNEVVLRSQAQAEYNPHNIGHFGLNLRRYAHFTSPIRRYADLIVHRGLIRALGLGDDGLPEGIEAKLEAIGAEVSAAERRAMLAERDTIDRLIALWMTDRIGARFSGRISGVVKSGLFIRLDDSGADGFVPASTIGLDYYRYDEASHALVGDRSGETYQLGDRVEVELVEAAPFAGALRFALVSEGRKDRKAGRRAGAAARGARQASSGRRTGAASPGRNRKKQG
ncbi:ribonuclease R [Polymorphum gilvum]|uniref:Ribonuclease R n=1 Tax=Polymorphum gilvum (strain LMG 25793 / CGMCC 1.9160 / SL003B-26A1) TaxID=991905 RepID=F2IVY9_POLGS|nr:ribonuclease R [Polymorphum gilvum]ADZ70271.1 Exoribonuclease protein [Polymorphum gilvum SL003B-26A1]